LTRESVPRKKRSWEGGRPRRRARATPAGISLEVKKLFILRRGVHTVQFNKKEGRSRLLEEHDQQKEKILRGKGKKTFLASSDIN